MERNKQDTGSFSQMVGKVIIALVVIILITIMKAFVLTKLWGWFVVPYFYAPEISITLAAGLMNMYALIGFRKMPKEEEEKSFTMKLTEAFIFALVSSGMALLVGYIISLLL